jgi:hypothetical protein
VVSVADIIASGDKYKKIIKIADKWIRSKLGASVEVVHADMENCGNPAFSIVDELINMAADSIDEKYQQKMVRNYGELFLWILYKDTAYRDVAIWLLYQLANNGDELKEMLKPYLRQPDEWYVNSWNKSKRHTAKLRKEGKISSVRKALDEDIFTPPTQRRMLKKYK